MLVFQMFQVLSELQPIEYRDGLMKGTTPALKRPVLKSK
jgi:hypothetical protein